MPPEDERSRPAGNEAATKQLDQERSPSVTDRRAAERERRSRRWARRELDDLLRNVPPSSITTADVLSLAVAPPGIAAAAQRIRQGQCHGGHDGEHDYWGACTGMNLGWPERVAAGLAMLGRERSA